MQVKGQGELNEHVIFESNDAVCRKLSYQNWSKVGAFFGDTVYKSCGQPCVLNLANKFSQCTFSVTEHYDLFSDLIILRQA